MEDHPDMEKKNAFVLAACCCFLNTYFKVEIHTTLVNQSHIWLIKLVLQHNGISKTHTLFLYSEEKKK